MTAKDWTACCRGKGCPQVTIDSDFIYIKDDHGGQIKITTSEFSSVSKTIRVMMTNLLERSMAEKDINSRKTLHKLFGKETEDASSE